MEYEQIKNWLKDNEYQNSGLRTDKYHRIDLYLSDVLYRYSKETFQQLQTRIKELEEEKNTTVIKVFDDVTQIEYAFCSKCYEQLNNVLNNENYCPNCGRKIKK